MCWPANPIRSANRWSWTSTANHAHPSYARCPARSRHDTTPRDTDRGRPWHRGLFPHRGLVPQSGFSRTPRTPAAPPVSLAPRTHPTQSTPCAQAVAARRRPGAKARPPYPARHHLARACPVDLVTVAASGRWHEHGAGRFNACRVGPAEAASAEVRAARRPLGWPPQGHQRDPVSTAHGGAVAGFSCAFRFLKDGVRTAQTLVGGRYLGQDLRGRPGRRRRGRPERLVDGERRFDLLPGPSARRRGS